MKTIIALVLISLVCRVTAASSTDLSGVADAYERSRAVFIGKVVKIEPFTTELDADFSRYDKVTFNVEYSWKGAGFRDACLREFVVLLQVSERERFGLEPFPAHPVSFSENKKYLVVADQRPDKEFPVVMAASRSKPLWDASNELKELKRLDGPFPFRTRQVAPETIQERDVFLCAFATCFAALRGK